MVFNMFTQKKYDIISCLFCIGLGITFLIGSFKYGGIHSGIPNAGLFPFLSALILILLSLIVLISAIKKKGVGRVEKFFPQKYSWKRLLLLLFSLFAYAIALGYLGFLLTTFIFMIFLLKFIEPQKWITTIITSFLTATFSYIIFQLLLKVQLPHGMEVFWKINFSF